MSAAPNRFVAGEGPTQRMVAAILQYVAQGFTEAGCPLNGDQQAFIDDAVAQVLR